MNDELEMLSTRFAKFVRNPENHIPIKVLQKIQCLEQSLRSPTIVLDFVEFDQLEEDELKNLHSLNESAKVLMYKNIVNVFLKGTKVIGRLHILGKSQVVWTERELVLDIDVRELQIERENKNDKPHCIDLSKYELKFEYQRLFSKYCIILTNSQDKSGSIFAKITLGSNHKEDINQWWEPMKQCCAREIHLTEQTEYQRQHLQTIATQSMIQQRKSSDEPQVLQSEINNVRRKNQTMALNTQSEIQFKVAKVGSDKCIKVVKEDIQPKLEVPQTMIPVKVIQPVERIYQPLPLPNIFSDLQSKLNYTYLIDEEGFDLVSFESGARILQNRHNSYNFKIIMSLPKVPMEILITALFDSHAQMRWNQQIKSQTIVNQPTSILAEILEVRQPLNSFYGARKFQFMRYLHIEREALFVIEKGDFASITGVFIQGDNKLLVVDTSISNGGLITKSQDTQLSIIYLKQYANLKVYLKEERQKNIMSSIAQPLYVQEVMLQFAKIRQQSQNIKSASEDQIQVEDLSFNASELDKQVQLEQVQQISPILVQSEIQPTASFQETNDQYLRRLLGEVQQQKHYSSQLHNYCLEPQCGNYNNNRFQVNADGYHFFYQQDWQYDEKKGILKFINKVKIDNQKKVIKYMLSKIGSNLVQGKSILNISLPVHIFEKRANLERFAASFAYAPHFLEPVANDLPIEQMKACVCFVMSTTIAFLTLDKPFNPILGETFQCFVKGCPLYLEQISHHPPIASFILYGRGYKFYGRFETVANMGPNTISGAQLGSATIEFEKGAKIEYVTTKGYMSGITIGDRTFYSEGPLWLIDSVGEFLCDLYINPNSGYFNKKGQVDFYEGRIYKIDSTEVEKWRCLSYKKYTGLKGLKHNYETVAQIDGNWQSMNNNCRIDQNVVFRIDRDFPFELELETNPLASDSIYREDIIAWKMNNFDLTMELKDKLEQLQRLDRKLRGGHK